jgi:hypothetical protein
MLPLTEDDIALLVRAAPALSRLAHHSERGRSDVTIRDATVGAITKNIEWVRDVPGINTLWEKLGTDWPTFRGAAYRMWMASCVVAARYMAPGLDSILRYERRGMAKAHREKVNQALSIGRRLPSGNTEIVIRHMRDLAPVWQAMGHKEP